jgi:hypothetical protein
VKVFTFPSVFYLLVGVILLGIGLNEPFIKTEAIVSGLGWLVVFLDSLNRKEDEKT